MASQLIKSNVHIVTLFHERMNITLALCQLNHLNYIYPAFWEVEGLGVNLELQLLSSQTISTQNSVKNIIQDKLI